MELIDDWNSNDFEWEPFIKCHVLHIFSWVLKFETFIHKDVYVGKETKT